MRASAAELAPARRTTRPIAISSHRRIAPDPSNLAARAFSRPVRARHNRRSSGRPEAFGAPRSLSRNHSATTPVGHEQSEGSASYPQAAQRALWLVVGAGRLDGMDDQRRQGDGKRRDRTAGGPDGSSSAAPRMADPAAGRAVHGARIREWDHLSQHDLNRRPVDGRRRIAFAFEGSVGHWLDSARKHGCDAYVG